MIRSVICTSLATVFIFFFASCHKDSPYVPACISDIIQQKEADTHSPGLRAVWQYNYDGMTVYYFVHEALDYDNDIYDLHCNYLCSVDGGWAPSDCPDFHTKKNDGRLVWGEEW